MSQEKGGDTVLNPYKKAGVAFLKLLPSGEASSRLKKQIDTRATWSLDVGEERKGKPEFTMVKGGRKKKKPQTLAFREGTGEGSFRAESAHSATTKRGEGGVSPDSAKF